jgi:HdeA/HdeB family protein
MRRFAFALAVLLALPIVGRPETAHALNDKLPCDSFAKNADGSWTVLHTTFIEGPDVKVQEDALVSPGRNVRGYDIADLIAKACPNAQVSPSPGAAGEASTAGAAAALPPVSAAANLGKYADANGSLDVRQLTCGHLADASADEAQLLLSWYSGWYFGSEKKRGVNLPRVRYNLRTVMDYCKTNREKRLSDVMDLMLK